MSLFTLRIVAMVTMVIDHIGYLFFPQQIVFRIVGRVSFIIFAFMVSEGMFYTKNPIKYIGRMLLLGVVSEIPFNLFVSGAVLFPEVQNVCFTLAFGAGLCYLYKLNNWGFKIGGFLAIVVIMYCVNFDYYLQGALVIFIMYLCRKNKNLQVVGVTTAVAVTLTINSLQMYSFLAMPFILMYNKNVGKKYPLFFYLFYPVHLLILVGIKFYMV